jgi:hypothetical protein
MDVGGVSASVAAGLANASSAAPAEAAAVKVQKIAEETQADMVRELLASVPEPVEDEGSATGGQIDTYA